GRAGRAAGTDTGGRAPPPRGVDRRGRDRPDHAAAAWAPRSGPSGEGVRDHRLRPHLVPPGVRRPGHRRPAVPGRDGRGRRRGGVRGPPGRGPGGALPRRGQLAPRGRSARGTGRRTVGRRLRGQRPPGARRPRRAGLPAPLPGLPRGRAVPAVVRGRDGRVRPPAGNPCPTPRHHRSRRRRLHHLRSRKDPRMTTAPVNPVVPAVPAALEGIGRYDFGWSDTDTAGASARRGLSEEVVRDISAKKNEPEWMLDIRLKGLKLFDKKPMPNLGSDLSGIDFDNIKYFVRSTEKQATSWDELPADIKNTYDKLGIPEAEKQRLIA